MTAGSQQTKYYWVCLRRPANPFAPVSAANPMLVVDAMRFPYIDGTAPLTGQGPTGGPTTVPNLTASQVNTAYSAQRFQPYRGGHAVPVAAGTPAGGAAHADARCPLWLHRADRGADGIFQPAGDSRDLLHQLGG